MQYIVLLIGVTRRNRGALGDAPLFLGGMSILAASNGDLFFKILNGGAPGGAQTSAGGGGPPSLVTPLYLIPSSGFIGWDRLANLVEM